MEIKKIEIKHISTETWNLSIIDDTVCATLVNDPNVEAKLSIKNGFSCYCISDSGYTTIPVEMPHDCPYEVLQAMMQMLLTLKE